MICINDAFEDQVQITLNLIIYEKAKTMEQKEQNVQALSSDLIEIVEKNHSFMKMLVGREITTSPEGIFHIIVKFEITWKTKDWEIVSVADNKEIIHSMLLEKKDFLNTIAARESMMIAQIISSIGIPPLITPAEIILKAS